MAANLTVQEEFKRNKPINKYRTAFIMTITLNTENKEKKDVWEKLPKMIKTANVVGSDKMRIARLLELSTDQEKFWLDSLNNLGFDVDFIQLLEGAEDIEPTPSPRWHRGQVVWVL